MVERVDDIFAGDLERAQEWSDFSSLEVLEAVAMALGAEGRERVEAQLEYWRSQTEEAAPEAD